MHDSQNCCKKRLLYEPFWVRILLFKRGVAQFGSALDWGSRGRWFKSSRPDFYNLPFAKCLHSYVEQGTGLKRPLSQSPIVAFLGYDCPRNRIELYVRVDPRLSVLATEQLVGLRVADDHFLLAVPFDAAAKLE